MGSDEYQARKAVVIATGSRVKGIPQIGLEINKTTVISSDEALFLTEVPKTLAVIGAGAVGCEFADIFHAFGTKVTLIEALPRILPLEDAEASDALAKSYRKRGIAVLRGRQGDEGHRGRGQGDARVRGRRQEGVGRGREGPDGGGPGGEHRVDGVPGGRASSSPTAASSR